MDDRCKNPQQHFEKLSPTIYKKHYAPWPSEIYPKEAKLVQHLKASSSYQQGKGGKQSHHHINRHIKVFDNEKNF